MMSQGEPAQKRRTCSRSRVEGDARTGHVVPSRSPWVDLDRRMAGTGPRAARSRLPSGFEFRKSFPRRIAPRFRMFDSRGDDIMSNKTWVMGFATGLFAGLLTAFLWPFGQATPNAIAQQPAKTELPR